ncbi:hypothetical protein VNO77_27788 [Canavalia gladiata]|uniref:Peptidase A1 domain-containing protein n=1 Tax=Canavalia gladiata TaxID=3824 RepID=A0AAN9QAU2_CANGL
MRNAALRSVTRSNRFALSRNTTQEGPRTITTPDADTGEYLMRIYIGTPGVERFAIADTGSDLIWIQCSPCKKCTPQTTPLFDPKKSSTFKGLPCDSQPCTLLSNNGRRCGKSGKCEYLYQYGDNSYTIGNLGVESINFGSKGGGKGTTLTILAQSFYNKFVNLLTELFGAKPVKNPPEGNDLCFKIKIDEDGDCAGSFPEFVFHFTGAKVPLQPTNLLQCYPDYKVICVMVQSTSDNGVSVFGNQAQVGFQVEYDLQQGMVSFAPADCSKH